MRVSPSFDVSSFLQKAVGKGMNPRQQMANVGDTSKRSVDEFEFRQAAREIRLEISKETNPSRRAALIEGFKATVSADAFAKDAGPYAAKFKELFAEPENALLHTPGKELDQKSALRDDLLNILAGKPGDLYAGATAKDWAAKVTPDEKNLVLKQLEQTLAELKPALQRLPKATAFREAEGTDSKQLFPFSKAILELTAARLRQPDIASLMDDFGTVKNRRFTHATLADTGVSQRDFLALESAAVEAMSKNPVGTGNDLLTLWKDLKESMGREVKPFDANKGFAAIEYSGDPAGPSFSADVARFEKTLQEKSSFKILGGQPIRSNS
jgi:hypothetical protein